MERFARHTSLAGKPAGHLYHGHMVPSDEAWRCGPHPGRSRGNRASCSGAGLGNHPHRRQGYLTLQFELSV